MNIDCRIFIAGCAVFLAAAQVNAECGGFGRVTVLDVPIPSAKQVDEALFPPEIAGQKKECAQMEKAGFRCQSVIPKSSLDSAQVTFKSGSAELSNEAKVFLNSVGESLTRHQDEYKSLTIEGHADVTGNENNNKTLSKQRAEAVNVYMSANFGIINIETQGRGSEKLRDPANPRAEVNRRIEFIPNW